MKRQLLNKEVNNILLSLLDAPTDLVARSICCDWIEEFCVGLEREYLLSVLQSSMKLPSCLCITTWQPLPDIYWLSVVFSKPILVKGYDKKYSKHDLLTGSKKELPTIHGIDEPIRKRIKYKWFRYHDEEALWKYYDDFKSLVASI